MLWHGVLVIPLHIVGVRKGLVGIHRHARDIAGWHMGALRHAACLLRCKMARVGLLGRIDLVSIVDAVIAGRCWFRSVQACLRMRLVCMPESCEIRHCIYEQATLPLQRQLSVERA